MNSFMKNMMENNYPKFEKVNEEMSAERKRILEEIKRKEKEAEEKRQKELDDLYDDKKPNEDGELPPYWQH